jgi:AraC-like DNA-binding protein
VSEIVRADALRGFRELVVELGGDGEALLSAAGIAPAALDDGDCYISFRAVIDVVECAAAALKCPDFGMRMARRTGVDMLGPIAVAVRNAATAREAFAVTQRFMHFHNPSARLDMARFDAVNDFIGVSLVMRRPPRYAQVIERGVARSHAFLTMACGEVYRPAQVWFAHEPVSPLAVYRDVFGVTPSFGMAESGLIVPRALLDTMRPDANPQLRRMAEHFLEVVTPAATEAFEPHARAMIARLMRDGACTSTELADAFAMHERTLQRRLKAEGTSFDAIRDEVRRELAQTHLAQRNVPLSHIAEMLGYAEASAFTRACRRWFGEAPREVRRRMAV